MAKSFPVLKTLFFGIGTDIATGGAVSATLTGGLDAGQRHLERQISNPKKAAKDALVGGGTMFVGSKLSAEINKSTTPVMGLLRA